MSPRFAAVLAAVLFASILGVLVAVGSFGVLRVLEGAGEAFGLLPNRWGENNPEILMTASGVVAIPVVLWFLVWFYKKALAAELMLETYKYTPPEAPKTGKI
jgi:hypothetical protein